MTSKNIWLLFLFLNLFLPNAQAQENKINLIAEAGINTNFPTGNLKMLEGTSWGVGFVIGGLVKVNLTSFLSLQSGIEFQRKSILYPVHPPQTAKPTDQTEKMTFSYGVVPIMIGGTFGNNQFFFLGNLGAYAGFLSSATFLVRRTAGSVSISHYVQRNTDLYRTLDTGIIMAAGIAFPLRKDLRLGLLVRDDLSLRNPNYEGGKPATINSTALMSQVFYSIAPKPSKSRSKNGCSQF